MGLAPVRTGKVPEFFSPKIDEARRRDLRGLSERLRPPPLIDLPVMPDDQVKFLQAHALGGDRWPDNGLTMEQNRELYASEDANRVALLVSSGLEQVAARQTRQRGATKSVP